MDETTTSETFAFEKRYHYPHMKPNDIAIWERFIDKYPDAYDNCQYDVHVGEDPNFDTNTGSTENDQTWRLYQKKIDVVAFKGEKINLIELKPNAGASAIGQIKLYRRLYVKDYSPSEQPKCLIITDSASNDIVAFAKEEGVEIVIV